VSGQQRLQSTPTPSEQTHRCRYRSYTVAEICDALRLNKRTFFRLRAKGELPFLEELQPRLGRLVRYRADLVDRYLAGQWGRSRFFGKAS